MKIRFIIVITSILFVISAAAGLSFRNRYKDYNVQENPLNQFEVGLISDDVLDVVVDDMENKVDSVGYIIAVRCEEKPLFRYNCFTERVSVVQSFKGDLHPGDIVDVGRFGSDIYMDSEWFRYYKMPFINTGFANVMEPGETYLVFLERILKTGTGEMIGVTPECLTAMIFCYEDLKNIPLENTTTAPPEYLMTATQYTLAKNNEFFLMSEAAIEKVNQFKHDLLNRYPLNKCPEE